MVTSKALFRKKRVPKAQTKSKPFHYISSDGFDIFVGKNNFQNDELTFKRQREMTGGFMQKKW